MDSKPSSAAANRFLVFASVAYVVVGLATAELARLTPTPQLRTVWRLAAWGLSAAIFLAHVVNRHRAGDAPVRGARLAAGAVALATLVLAGTAVARQVLGATFRPTMVLAFGIWPLLTGVASFLVALAVATVLRRLRPGAPAPPINRRSAG